MSRKIPGSRSLRKFSNREIQRIFFVVGDQFLECYRVDILVDRIVQSAPEIERDTLICSRTVDRFMLQTGNRSERAFRDAQNIAHRILRRVTRQLIAALCAARRLKPHAKAVTICSDILPKSPVAWKYREAYIAAGVVPRKIDHQSKCAYLPLVRNFHNLSARLCFSVQARPSLFLCRLFLPAGTFTIIYHRFTMFSTPAFSILIICKKYSFIPASCKLKAEDFE